jgi:hypothetical protein
MKACAAPRPRVDTAAGGRGGRRKETAAGKEERRRGSGGGRHGGGGGHRGGWWACGELHRAGAVRVRTRDAGAVGLTRSGVKSQRIAVSSPEVRLTPGPINQRYNGRRSEGFRRSFFKCFLPAYVNILHQTILSKYFFTPNNSIQISWSRSNKKSCQTDPTVPLISTNFQELNASNKNRRYSAHLSLFLNLPPTISVTTCHCLNRNFVGEIICTET